MTWQPAADLSTESSPAVTDPAGRRRERNAACIVAAYGEPALWLTGGALMMCLLMIAGLMGMIIYQGFSVFWPLPVVRIEMLDGRVCMGEITRREHYKPGEDVLDSFDIAAQEKIRQQLAEQGGLARRQLVRTGNFELTNEHFQWVSDFQIKPGGETRPAWAMVFERLTWGRFYGLPKAFLIDGRPAATDAEEIWQQFCTYHPQVQQRWRERKSLERFQLGRINQRLDSARLHLRQCELDFGVNSPEWKAADKAMAALQEQMEAEAARISQQAAALDAENGRFQIVVTTADGQETALPLADIVRAYPANRLSLPGKFKLYASRIGEFLSAEPRQANSEGGVFPAIFGTLVMTLLMCVVVAPLGVLAALYLREYTKAGWIVSTVRVAVNNLAGVPSIVFGVFGLGFFCYLVGGSIDAVFFEARLPSPTFGTGGVLWASLTLALLTLPVVIVAAEEALAAVPNSVREGSYACGATKWQTIRRVVLPRALPGILTGVILAMARGAGEVAPLMLVGAVKLAPELPVDGVFPYVHLERSFMHLGFHIYDLGFQSQNSEAAKPMVFATALLLILIVVILNLAAIWLRGRLHRRFEGAAF